MKSGRINSFTGTMIAIAVIAACLGVFLFLDLYRTQQNSRRSYADAVHGLDLLGELQYQAQEARRTLLYALSTTDSKLQTEFTNQSRAAEGQVATRLLEYQNLALTSEHAANAFRLAKHWMAYIEVRDQFIASMLEGDPKTAIERDLRDGVPIFNSVRWDLENIKVLLKKSADELLNEVDTSFQRSLIRIAGILAVLAVLGFIIAKTAQDQTLLTELRDTEARLQADFAQAQREEHATAELLAAVLRAATEYSIIGTDLEGVITVFNHGAERILGYSAQEMVGKLTPAVIHYPAEVIARAAELGIAPGFEVFVAAARRGVAETREWTYLRKNGSHFPVTLTVTAMRDSAGELTGFIGIAADISERKTNEEALKQSQQKLLETSRLAGKAEVATSVLHNVGNVLNSVNVSGNVLSERLRGSKVTILAKIADLLNEQRADFSGFVANDPRGKRIPDLIATLSEALREENHELLAEVSVITSHIGHIKEIVSMQQNYSKIGGVTENLEISDLLEDAMRMNAASLARHQIKVRQEYESVPKLQVDRHKVLQILVNLLNNAKQSVEESGREDKQVTLKIQNNGGQFIKISIQDNGVGIASNNLNRIFSHGFTTKKTGHGFGLHSGALAAVEAGGALRVQSDGLGKGATFTLELPVIPPSRTTQAKKQDASLLS